MEDIKQKYLKYKKKYLQLKQIGGQYCDDAYSFGNTIGTCWYVSSLMMFLYSDYYRDTSHVCFEDLYTTITTALTNPKLYKLLPEFYFNDNNYEKGLKEKVLEKFYDLFNAIKLRLDNKQIDTTGLKHPQLTRRTSSRCEAEINDHFKSLVNSPLSESPLGGTFDTVFFILFISIFITQKQISLTKPTYELESKYTEKTVGILILYTEHVAAFYKCNGSFFYYDSEKSTRLIQYEYKNLLQKFDEYANFYDKFKIYNITLELEKLTESDPEYCMFSRLYKNIQGPFLYNETKNEIYACIDYTFDTFTEIGNIDFDFFDRYFKYFMIVEDFIFCTETDLSIDEYKKMHSQYYNLFNEYQI